jgi:hypothetical protein
VTFSHAPSSRALGRSDLAAWPDFSRDALARDPPRALPSGITRRSQLTRVPLPDALRARLS